MMRTGQELYALYTRAMSEQGVGIDEWDDLDETERDAWRRLAIMLMDENGD